jgi:hypothetical protein
MLVLLLDPETSVNLYQTALRNIPGDNVPYRNRCGTDNFHVWDPDEVLDGTEMRSGLSTVIVLERKTTGLGML